MPDTYGSGRRPPPPPSPSPLAGALVGASLGVFGALAFAGVEAALLSRVGLDLPGQPFAERVLAAYAVTGGLLGGATGLAGLRGAGWALATVVLGAGWLLSGHVGERFVASGAQAWTGPALMLPIAACIAFLLVRMVEAFPRRLALATAVFVLLALELPLAQHLLGGLSAATAMLHVLVLLLAAIASSLVVVLTGQGGTGAVLVPVLAVGALGWGLAWPALEREERSWPVAEGDAGPPLVLVTIDGLRPDRTGVGGHARPTTPTLDAAARRGLLYEDATTAAPWDLPAVASLLTGRTPSRHGAGFNPGDGNRLSALGDVPTLPALLKEHGYTTAAIVTSETLTDRYGLRRGFDRYDDRTGPAALPSALHPLASLGLLDLLGWSRFRGADAVVDAATAFVEAQSHRQWFLLVHLADPVHRRPAPEAIREALGGGDTVEDRYDASVRWVDANLDRLLSALPREAWVVVAGTHGLQLGEQRSQGFPTPGGVRHGHSVHRELRAVPLLVLGPRAGARRIGRAVSTTDVAPTLLKLASVRAPDDLDGRPLVEVVGGTADEARAIVTEATRFGPEQKVARVGRYVLLSTSKGRKAFFDLERDPFELAPVREASPSRQQWERTLEVALPSFAAHDVPKSVPAGADLGELLERLGGRD